MPPALARSNWDESEYGDECEQKHKDGSNGVFCCGRPCESKMLNPFGFSVAARVYHEAHEQIVSPNEN